MIRQVTRAVPEPFARQRLIDGWNQERIESARILVAGVGALGNACAADLVLTGARHLVVVDFDQVSVTNLSRAMLFRRGDEGQRKVALAQRRLVELAPTPNTQIVPLDADVVCGVGLGVYRRADVVLACVDSTEARIAVGAAAWSLGVPAIIGGLFGLDSGIVVQGISEGACIACTLTQAEWAERAARYSCDDVRRATPATPVVPATQVLASLTGALMVNEAIHLLVGDHARSSTRIFFTGRGPDLVRMRLPRRERCVCHDRIFGVIEQPTLSATMSAGAVLEALAARHGTDVELDLGRDFLVSAACKGCARLMTLHKPRHRATERDLACDDCRTSNRQLLGDPQFDVVRALNLNSAPPILQMTLEELGIPPLHVLAISSSAGVHWIELTGDVEQVLPDWPHRNDPQEAACR